MSKYLPFDKSPLPLWPVPWYLQGWYGGRWRTKNPDGSWRVITDEQYDEMFAPPPPKQTPDELQALLEPFVQYEGSRLVHRKSGGVYHLRDVTLRESDKTVRFTYFDVQHPRLKWDRPIEELLDGRWVIGDFGLIDGDLANV